jgi:hypothetical protein
MEILSLKKGGNQKKWVDTLPGIKRRSVVENAMIASLI